MISERFGEHIHIPGNYSNGIDLFALQIKTQILISIPNISNC